MNEKRIVKPWQAGLMLLVGIAVIIAGLLVMKLNNRYRYRCLLVGKNDRPTREAVSWLLKAFANDRANRGMNLFVDCNSMK